MQLIDIDVRRLITKEYENAALIHGEFNNSSHESYGIIKEEYDEMQQEMQEISIRLEYYWKAVKSDNYRTQRLDLQELLENTTCMICEAVQFAAMCDKALKSLER